jgi:hypothetical protein
MIVTADPVVDGLAGVKIKIPLEVVGAEVGEL